MLGGGAEVLPPALHRAVGEKVLQAGQVLGHGDVFLAFQVAVGQVQGQGEVAQPVGQPVQVRVGGPFGGEVPAEEGAALLRRELVQRQDLQAQVVGPIAAAGGEEQPEVGVAKAVEVLPRSLEVLQVVQEEQAGAVRLPDLQHAVGVIVPRLTLRLAQAHLLAAGGDPLAQQGRVAHVEPVDAPEAVAVPVGELHHQLGLAHAAHPGDGLGDDPTGGVPAAPGVRAAHHLRQAAQVLLPAGEEGIAGGGQIGAGGQVAGEGDLLTQGGQPFPRHRDGVPRPDDDDAVLEVAQDQHLPPDQGLAQGAEVGRQGIFPQPGKDLFQFGLRRGETRPLLLADLEHDLADDREGVVLEGKEGHLKRLGIQPRPGVDLGGGQSAAQVAGQGLPQGPLHAGQVHRLGQVGQHGLHRGKRAEVQGEGLEEGGVVAAVAEFAVGAAGDLQELASRRLLLEPPVQAGLQFLPADLGQGPADHPQRFLTQPGLRPVPDEGDEEAEEVFGQVGDHRSAP